MGDLSVSVISTQKQLNEFTKHILTDIKALERMLEEGWFNEDPIHMGAEQELCIVDEHCKPSPKSMNLISGLDPDVFTTELALFNLEANLPPLQLEKDCFSRLEKSINTLFKDLRVLGKKENLDFVITGILPTIRKFDLDINNLTPMERYYALLKAISKMRGKQHELRIHGLDELNITHDSAMLESCNTSFQVHLQVRPDDFVCKYNTAQILTAPVMAIATNSPLLFGKRLWSETRIALFRQSIDTRRSAEYFRDRNARVMFGNGWLKNSITDMYKEDISRFRVFLTTDFDKDSLILLDQGKTPRLKALSIHNSTVYRWNRACYGISANGKPHLRIENRVFPAGPSVIDEVSNAAFWIGLMNGFGDECKDIENTFDFDDAKDNFMSAARDGLNTDFSWAHGKKYNATELIAKELIPLARQGLEKCGIVKNDIDRYMDVIEARNENRQTGTSWIIKSYSGLQKEANREEISIAITSGMLKNQKLGKPVHEWKLASLNEIKSSHPYAMLVEEFMTTDLFTVQEKDILELVSDLMSWQGIKYVPVEDDKGMLKGLVDFRIILAQFNRTGKDTKVECVKDIMNADPVTIEPDATIFEALHTMRTKKVDCLPVVSRGKLIGIISEGNFLNITASLLKGLNNK